MEIDDLAKSYLNLDSVNVKSSPGSSCDSSSTSSYKPLTPEQSSYDDLQFSGAPSRYDPVEFVWHVPVSKAYFPESEVPYYHCGKMDDSQLKRRYVGKMTDHKSRHRNVANVRERTRTKNLNDAYTNLREIIPSLPSDKLSKIHTLKLACDYIEFLCQILQEGNSNGPKNMLEQTITTSGNTVSYDPLSFAFNMWRVEGEYSSGQ
ncbi:TWIST2 (predicted) [Pycnogonum litorale]